MNNNTLNPTIVSNSKGDGKKFDILGSISLGLHVSCVPSPQGMWMSAWEARFKISKELFESEIVEFEIAKFYYN